MDTDLDSVISFLNDAEVKKQLQVAKQELTLPKYLISFKCFHNRIASATKQETSVAAHPKVVQGVPNELAAIVRPSSRTKPPKQNQNQRMAANPAMQESYRQVVGADGSASFNI